MKLFGKFPKLNFFFGTQFFFKKNQILTNDPQRCRRYPRSAAGATRGPPQALGFWRCGAPPKKLVKYIINEMLSGCLGFVAEPLELET